MSSAAKNIAVRYCEHIHRGGGLATYWTRDLEEHLVPTSAEWPRHSLRYVNRLVDAGIINVTDDEQPRRYTAPEIDLTVTTAVASDHEYTITLALIDAVGRRETDADIDTYIDRHGIAGLATALTYAVAWECGGVTHQLIAEDLYISPLAAEMILQALRPVVHEHYAIEEAGSGLDELDIDDGDAADDA